MFSYFQGPTPQPDLEHGKNGLNDMDQPMPEGLEAVDASTKATLLSQIDQNSFTPRKETWNFRRGYGTMEFVVQTAAAAIVWLYATFYVSQSPYGKADQMWLANFALMFIIWSCIVHAAAYFPTPPISVEAVSMSTREGFNYARQNWAAYNWCLCLIAVVVIFYPVMIFYGVIMTGFNPYENLSPEEKKLENDTTGNLSYLLRVGLHTAFMVLLAYMFIMFLVFMYIKNTRRFAGHHTWIAVRMGKLPLGAIFFYPGESFDCGICFEATGLGIHDVVRCGCNQTHVYHSNCLRSQIADNNNKFCVLCHTEITIAPKPE